MEAIAVEQSRNRELQEEEKTEEKVKEEEEEIGPAERGGCRWSEGGSAIWS